MQHRLVVLLIAPWWLACAAKTPPGGGSTAATGGMTASGGGVGSITGGTAGAASGGAQGAGGAIAGRGGTGSITGDAGGAENTGGAAGGGGRVGVDMDMGTSDAPAETSVNATCPTGGICDDFEAYATGALSLAPKWTAYKFGGGTLQVDTSKAFKGHKSLHLTVPAGGRKYADLIKETPDDVPVLPIKHYGRVMLWVTNMPAAAHWNINQAAGLMANSTDLVAKYSLGGQNRKLEPNYTQRNRSVNGMIPLRGGGPETDADATARADCATEARTQTLTTKKWVCWEWMFDGAANQVRLWLDGVAQSEIDINGMGQRCLANNIVWQGPRSFTKLIIGWEQYTQPSDVANEVWIDDLVMGSDRVGCPAP